MKAAVAIALDLVQAGEGVDAIPAFPGSRPDAPVPMKLSCSQTVLNSNLQYVSYAITARPTHPILANVLLVADAETGKVTLTGYDLSVGIQTTLSATVEVSGALALPARLFVDMVQRLLPDSAIALQCRAGETLLELTATTGSYKIQGLPADDYPELPVVQKGVMLPLPASTLCHGLGCTLFAASTDEAKQYLTGVHIKVADGKPEFAATDGHRLAVSRYVHDAPVAAAPDADAGTAAATSSNFSVTVPARSLRELDRLLSASTRDDDVSLYCDQGQIVFQWADQVITSRTLDGDYPKYPELIPASFSRSVTMNRRAFMASLERIAVLAEQRSKVVRLRSEMNQQRLHVFADVQDVGSGSETLSIGSGDGEDFETAFNVRYLLEGLKVMSVSDVMLKLNSPKSPAVLSPAGKGGIHFIYLVMPIQLAQ